MIQILGYITSNWGGSRKAGGKREPKKAMAMFPAMAVGWLLTMRVCSVIYIVYSVCVCVCIYIPALLWCTLH